MAFKHEPPGHQGITNIWLTPKAIIDSLGPFDLDPCAAPKPRPWETASTHYVELDNGLAKPWFGMVWCNPPYGKETGTWLKRLSEHNNGIALIFARTETAWFQAVAGKATLLLFPAGRISFCKPDGTLSKSNAGAPSVFMAFGNEAANRLINSGIKGLYTENKKTPV
jgi:hypothetical protein